MSLGWYLTVIVNSLPNGWEVIYHRAHALLAAQIGSQLTARWHVGERPARLVETIAAISHHDDLAREWEDNNLSHAGTPLDFTLKGSTEPLSVAPLHELIEHARYRGRWVALLVSMHCSFLNEPKRGQNKEIDAFLTEQAREQKRLLSDLGINKSVAEQAYAFMQWCDRLSLILCQRALPARERALEVSKGPDGIRYDVMQHDDGTVTVTPWPFDTPGFQVDVEATYLSQPTFKSNSELIEALRTAPIKTIEWVFAAHQTKAAKRKRPTAEQRRAKTPGEE